MTFDEIVKKLDSIRENGLYVELPFYRSNERIYVTRHNGEVKLFHVRYFMKGHSIQPTRLDWDEERETRWQIRDFQTLVPSNFSKGWSDE